jgi:hypothetical protein
VYFTFFVLAVDDSVLRSGQDGKLTQRVGGNLIDLDTAICSFLNTMRPVMDYLRDYLAQGSSSSLPRLGFGRLDSVGTKVLFVKPFPGPEISPLSRCFVGFCSKLFMTHSWLG